MLIRTVAAIFLGLCFIPSSPVVIQLHREARSKGPLPVQRGGKWGYIDLRGKIVIPPAYDLADFFYEGLAGVSVNGKWGFVDPTGKLVVAPEYTSRSSFSDGLAWVFIDGATQETNATAFIDKRGEVVIKCRESCGRQYSEGMAADAIEVFRCVDENGKTVPKKYPCATDATGTARPILVDTWGYYDKTGGLAIPGLFHSGVSRFSEGLAAVVPHGTRKKGFINKDAVFVIPPRFDGAEAFSEGRAAIQIGEKWGFIDRQGNVVVEPQFDGVGAFSDGYAQVYVQRRAGYIDLAGGLVIFPRFQEAAPFSEGLAAVCCEGGKAGYIGKTGVFAIPPTFPPGHMETGPFSEGIALVRLETGGVYIDKAGKVIAKFSDSAK